MSPRRSPTRFPVGDARMSRGDFWSTVESLQRRFHRPRKAFGRETGTDGRVGCGGAAAPLKKPDWSKRLQLKLEERVLVDDGTDPLGAE
jgi:hypothetical protein